MYEVHEEEGELLEDGLSSGADSESGEIMSASEAEDPPTPETTSYADASGLRSWEVPWSLNEMREAEKWTLAADSGLLNYLKDFSDRLVGRTKEVEAEVDNLVNATVATDIQLRNTFNQFMLLASTQFIENRVYDAEIVVADETEAQESTAQEEDLTAAQADEILIPKYTQAISFGLDALKIFPQGGTGELMEEGDAEDIHIDVYAKYDLPHVIGTVEFHQDDFCGLFAFSESESEFEDEISESGGSLYSSSEYSDEYTDLSAYEKEEGELASDISASEDYSHRSSGSSDYTDLSGPESTESEGDIFGGSDSENLWSDKEHQEERRKERKKRREAKKKRKARKEGSESEAGEIVSSEGESSPEPETLQDKISAAIVGQAKGKQLPKSLRKKRDQRKQEQEKRDKEEERERNRRLKEERGEELSSSEEHSTNIFSDNSEPEDLPLPSSDTEQSEKKKSTKKKDPVIDIFSSFLDEEEDTGGLFDAGDDPFLSLLSGEATTKQPAKDKTPKKTKTKSKEETKSAPKKTAKQPGFFDFPSDEESEEEPMFEDTSTKKSKLPSDLEGEGGLFSDATDQEEGLFAGDNLFAPSSSKKTDRKKPVGGVSIFGAGGMFGDEEGDENLFSAPKSTKPKVNENTKSSVAPSENFPSDEEGGLFSDSIPGDNSLFSEPTEQHQKSSGTAKKRPAGAVSLFGGADISEEAGNLFSGGSGSAKRSASSQQKSKAVEATKTQSGGFFDVGEDEGGLFSTDDTSGIFSVTPKEAAPEQKKQITSAEKEKPQRNRKPVGGVSLFGGADIADEVSSLFASGTKGQSPKQARNQKAPKQREPKQAQAEPKQPKNQQKEPPATQHKKPVGGISLFGDDISDEVTENLFSGGLSEPQEKPQTKKTATTAPATTGGLFDFGDDADEGLFGGLGDNPSSGFSFAENTTESNKSSGGTSLFGGDAGGSLFADDGGLFSGGGLFGAEPESSLGLPEESEPNTPVLGREVESQPVAEKGSIFNPDEEEIPTGLEISSITATSSVGLFGDSVPEHHDSPEPEKKASETPSLFGGSGGGLFGDEPAGGLFGDFSPQSTNNKPTAVDSLFGAGGAFGPSDVQKKAPEASKQKQQKQTTQKEPTKQEPETKSAQEDKQPISNKSTKTKQAQPKTQKTPQEVPKEEKPKEEKPKEEKPKEEKTKKEKPKKAAPIGLFDEPGPIANQSPARKKKESNKVVDDLFADLPEKKPKKTTTRKPRAARKPRKTNSSAAKVDLFADLDVQKKSTNKSNEKKKKTTSKQSSTADIFADLPAKQTEAKKQSPKSTPSPKEKKKKNVESQAAKEEAPDISASPVPKKQETPISTEKTTTTNTATPNTDLFGNETKQEPTRSNKSFGLFDDLSSKPAEEAQQKKNVNLFGEKEKQEKEKRAPENDMGLFGGRQESPSENRSLAASDNALQKRPQPAQQPQQSAQQTPPTSGRQLNKSGSRIQALKDSMGSSLDPKAMLPGATAPSSRSSPSLDLDFGDDELPDFSDEEGDFGFGGASAAPPPKPRALTSGASLPKPSKKLVHAQKEKPLNLGRRLPTRRKRERRTTRSRSKTSPASASVREEGQSSVFGNLASAKEPQERALPPKENDNKSALPVNKRPTPAPVANVDMSGASSVLESDSSPFGNWDSGGSDSIFGSAAGDSLFSGIGGASPKPKKAAPVSIGLFDEQSNSSSLFGDDSSTSLFGDSPMTNGGGTSAPKKKTQQKQSSGLDFDIFSNPLKSAPDVTEEEAEEEEPQPTFSSPSIFSDPLS
eukprot:CAMPEP_0174255072 /NCGR_PEP_ID=MMETSP0439-20130205/4403_1 /TAXON_ID=0 /ORGANISM="Stereomyxa ramosa, Strain Chinc5" /LENGTH=1770 /DNA_ID=CAMNT_0015337061 /DNA_START=22 /DNA_END=5334 /DNA_ORIENTATION=-